MGKSNIRRFFTRTFKREVMVISAACLALCGSLIATHARATYLQSNPPPFYLSLPSTAIQSRLSDCDDCAYTVQLPWAFPFYGLTYGYATISANGFIVLGNTASAHWDATVKDFTVVGPWRQVAINWLHNRILGLTPSDTAQLRSYLANSPGRCPGLTVDNWRTFNLSSLSDNCLTWVSRIVEKPRLFALNRELSGDGTPSAPAPFLAPWWDDWSTAGSGDVLAGTASMCATFSKTGGCLIRESVYVIEWREVSHALGNSTQRYSFQVVLHRDGRFDFSYRQTNAGNAAVDSGASGTVGYQEGKDTIGQSLSYNAAGTVADNRSLRFTRPGTAALYAKVNDGFLSAPRRDVKIGFQYRCGTTVQPELTGSTDANGRLRIAGSACANPTVYTQRMFYHDTSSEQYEVEVIPNKGFDFYAVKGSYLFLRRSDVTPQPTARIKLPVFYSSTKQSVLDLWQSGPAWDKPIVIVPGIDPLDEATGASYYMLLGSVIAQLQADGYDVAIGNWADGNQRVGSYVGEVRDWINQAWSRNVATDKRVQVAGVSMGGAVVRDTLSWSGGALSKTKAWYSLDAPQMGANLGRGDKGLQNLILCNASSSDPSYKRIFSNPAADMMTRRVTTCSCDDEPENSSCSSTTQYHDEYYNQVGWPSSTVPRYAISNGDGTGSYSRMSDGGYLYTFYYGAATCSSDGDWLGGMDDCLSGSKYVKKSDVYRHISDTGWCDEFTLQMRWWPAFINIHSSLAAAATASADDMFGTLFCHVQYDTFTVGSWTDYTSNNYHEWHHIISEPIEARMLQWIRSQP